MSIQCNWSTNSKRQIGQSHPSIFLKTECDKTVNITSTGNCRNGTFGICQKFHVEMQFWMNAKDCFQSTCPFNGRLKTSKCHPCHECDKSRASVSKPQAKKCRWMVLLELTLGHKNGSCVGCRLNLDNNGSYNSKTSLETQVHSINWNCAFRGSFRGGA